MTGRVLGLMLLLVVAGWGVGQVVRWAMPVGRDVSGDVAARAVLADTGEPREVARDADLTMVVFTDYRCPACRASAPALEAAVAADGRVTVAYRDWPIFGDASVAAARVALAVEPARYGALHRLLMRERRPLTPDVLFDLVARVGDDPARVRAVIARNSAAIDARLAANARAAAALGLPGTPAWLIGGVLVVGALDEAGFARAFASARRHARLK
ncbi:DsbA family protein [Sphingomonas sp. KR1UV-12]|uniref:DsbA family protein n=1 Tax=Sphingomonas aurea TaxID=3063994 RepID=A0ABT9EK03_9SPHN|nr:DsbA family protein [Sphingomonas sp. KR1UV-12]MDP1026948.1 DsbA family protein [Sphingomonas sp. KR1UV-12]